MPGTAAEANAPLLANALPYALTRGRYGPMLINRQDIYIGQAFERYGEYGELELDLLRQLVRIGDVVVEAGANIGADTVPLAQAVGSEGVVFAFEPQRLIHQLLCANIALNSLRNVVSPWAALGAEPGIAIVPYIDYARSGNYGGVSLAQEGAGESVVVMTIDSLKLSRCRLIKVDVEGMEQAVLQGSQETIRRHHPRLYVENNGGKLSRPLIESIWSLNYRLYWHTPPLFNPNNIRQNATNVYPGIVSTNMLGLPIDERTEVKGLRLIEHADEVALPSQAGR